MPRFKFNLQRVLEVRKLKEELLKNELAILRREYTHEESILCELESKRTEQLNEIRRRQSSPSILPDEMLWYYLYLGRLDSDIKRQRMKLSELQQKIETTKERLIKAAQDRSVLERLYERRFEEWKREQEKIEQAFLDEIAISMHTRGASQLSYKG